jgi:RNA-binding protein PNO1
MPKVSKKDKEDPLQDAAPMALDAEDGGQAAKPKFAPLGAYEQNGKRIEFRRVPVPQNRMTPLKNNWLSLYKPVTENLKLDMRMNLKTRKVRSWPAVDCPSNMDEHALLHAPTSSSLGSTCRSS